MKKEKPDIIVIGAGIIGISCALELQSKGLQVLVLDRKGVASETSAGNAGAFAFSDVIPLATPGIMRKTPKWLLDPLGPLSIPPAYALKITPWMMRFWRASWKDKYQHALTSQASLMSHSQSALERQILKTNGEVFIRREGQLQLYQGQKEYENSLSGWQTREEHGVAFDLLTSPDALAEIQPGIHSSFTHGAFTPRWSNVCDPKEWTQHLANRFLKMGGRIELTSVSRLSLKDQHVDIQCVGKTLSSDKVIIASGAWSNTLCKQLGDNLPLETERGYNTTLPNSDFELKTHLSFSNHGFVVTKVGEELRVGGAVELGGLELPPNFDRAKALLQKAAHFLPEINTQGGKEWMGFRPSMPDSLPVISTATDTNKVVYAFGHGHLGLTQSAGTAEIVADLIMNKTPDIPVDPYSIKRFRS
ncbi:NAD(P)/FAD-dependent oxidoreductase [Marinomonas mediterranea]|jgi:Glycine/D-amino acid oxidases (deaminating)|uniref:D-amino-acid dehydrogenase n=1 Tax=Marinomonas mediterranea (strain ATCC 700492 / JCM 21426 / NBRC 103028 / MMB-1) TaxID=717774 RepID=F2JUL1_MARM1|nr:FAD-dependent oxidoreductase [Marinomonas mediterranea]ADZ89344.1 D-amino-acid dehydrogenase [Marinomonas mediterranea MMB-1]WCN07445.1 FAD-dependent oxidoreductase [Marinomonas mediterranea]WCN15609.1 FAD-dependent oxidoreductase [Marinomonas mediterranea MMB-1]